ncbi:MAG TPA: signal peptidase I, partial [Bacteroidetes bacterium]|nr:signal peptidase I [Bacteroidota bacterium]
MTDKDKTEKIPDSNANETSKVEIVKKTEPEAVVKPDMAVAPAKDTVIHVTHNPKPNSKLKEYFDALLFAGLVAIILKIIFVEAYRIPTGSMENTLLVGDFLLVNKFIYGATTPRNIPFTQTRIPFFRLPALKEPDRGDVVVFDYPGNTNELVSAEVTNYIKRLIGKPGDTIQIVNKKLFVNSMEVPDPPDAKFNKNITSSTLLDIFPRGKPWNDDNYGPVVVPKKDDVI